MFFFEMKVIESFLACVQHDEYGGGGGWTKNVFTIRRRFGERKEASQPDFSSHEQNEVQYV